MIWGVITFPLLVLSLYGPGEWLRFRILGSEPFAINRIARAFGFGILANALLMTLLGFIHLLHPIIAAFFTGVPALVFWPVWWRDIARLFRKDTWTFRPTPGAVEIVFIVIIIGMVLLRGFNALAPNISWDATSHHYLVPSIWLKNAAVSDLPSVIYSYYPSLTEIGIAGTMALGTDFLSNLYGWLFGVLAILLLIGIGRRHFGLLVGSPDDDRGFVALKLGDRSFRISLPRFAGIMAALLFTLFPGVGVQTSGGYVDLPLACWVLLTIDLLFEFHRNRNTATLIAAALFAGACLATKHIALVIFPAFLIYLVWTLFLDKPPDTAGPRCPWRMLLIFVLVAILLPLPWYIRSAWFTGNPVYPFGLFGLPTPPQPPFRLSSWIRPDYQRSLIGFFTYWLHLTFIPTVGHALGRNYSLTFPLLLPLGVLIPKLKPSGRLLAVLAALSVLVIYAFFPVETRYHLPFIAPIALVLALLATRWLMNPPEWWTSPILLIGMAAMLYYIGYLFIEFKKIAVWTIDLAAVAVILVTLSRTRTLRTITISIFLLVAGIGGLVHDIQKDLDEVEARYKVVMNLEPEDRYLLRCSPRNYGSIHHINHEMDWQNMRILALEPRLYRLKADWVTWFGLKEQKVPTTPEENVAIWYRGGFTHILLGDDVQVKALMYYNIMHMDGWDVPGATPEEMIDYLREHPEEDTVYFRLPDLWYNFLGDRFVRNRHFTHFWLPREIDKEQYPTRSIDMETYYVASRLDILTDPERLAQYAFIRDFRELVASGGLKVAWTDELTLLFECDYPAYLESHPRVDLERLGLTEN